MKSVKLMSMIFLLLGFGKVGFCETFAKRGTLQRSGREVLKDKMFKKFKHYFPYNLCHSLRCISHDLLFLFCSLGPGSS